MSAQGYVAYRLPNEASVHSYSGDWIVSSDSNTEGFFLHPFEGNQLWVLPFENASTEQLHFDVINKKFNANTSQENHLEWVKDSIEKIRTNTFEKVVISRIENISNKKDINLLFNTLTETYPSAFCYCLFHPEFGYWMGASPETLMKFEGQSAATMALAGTLPLNPDNTVNWSTKEQEEQQFVVDEITTLLKKENVAAINVLPRTTKTAGKMGHLHSEIEFDLNNNSPLKIAQKLHPTSAVCGIPRNDALQHIITTEKHERKLYAGFLGPISEQKGHLFVNLRCTEVDSTQASLYIGGGITEKSDPMLEWNETALKANTMKKIIL